MPYKKISANCQQNSFPLLCPQDKEKQSKEGSSKILKFGVGAQNQITVHN